MYYAPDKLAMLILKFFLAMAIISIIVSVSNIAPFYLQLNSLANDIVLRGAVNNYVLESNVVDAVNNAFNNNALYSQLTYTSGKGTQGPSGRPPGVHVYAKATTSKTSDSSFGSGHHVGEYQGSFHNHNQGKVILNEGNDWDPKTKESDTVKFRGPSGTYKGAQRGDRITVRVESKMNGRIFFFGAQFPFQIPLAVEKSAPAMHYYRM